MLCLHTIIAKILEFIFSLDAEKSLNRLKSLCRHFVPTVEIVGWTGLWKSSLYFFDRQIPIPEK